MNAVAGHREGVITVARKHERLARSVTGAVDHARHVRWARCLPTRAAPVDEQSMLHTLPLQLEQTGGQLAMLLGGDNGAGQPPIAEPPPAFVVPPIAMLPPEANTPPVATEPAAACVPPVAIEPAAACVPPVVGAPPVVTNPPEEIEPPVAVLPPGAMAPPVEIVPPTAIVPPVATEPPVPPVVLAPPVANVPPVASVPPVELVPPAATAIRSPCGKHATRAGGSATCKTTACASSRPHGGTSAGSERAQ